MRRMTAVLFVVVLVLSMSSFAFAATDVPETHPANKEITTLLEKGYLAGYKDGTFRPDGNITRAEFVTMVNKAKGYEPGVVGVYFTDVPETAWYYTFVKAGLQAGYFTGYKDNTFRPQNNITREEVCTMLAQIEELEYTVTEEELAKIEIKDEVSAYATTFVKQCIAAGLMDLAEDGTFRAKELATRTDVAVACYRVLEKAGAFEEVTEVPGEEIVGGGGMGGGAVDGDVEAPSKATITKLTKALTALRNEIINDPSLNSTQKDIVTMVGDGIDQYLKDYSFDVQSYAENAKRKFKGMSESAQEDLINVINSVLINAPYYLDTSDLVEMRQYFGI